MGEILAKTDGIPLFVEELTKTVLESGILKDAGDGWRLDGPLPALAIPSTLQDSLVSRLDRLSLVKEVAQIGACIGREFGYELLGLVSPLKAPELEEALAQLVNNELVFCRGEIPEATFIFKHALVQDAARGTLLSSRRQQFHLKIANSIRQLYPEVEQLQPELLAYHFTEGGIADTAIELWKQAGEVARRRSANSEAIVHLTRALELVLGQPQDRERDQTELELQTTLGPVLMASRGYASQEVLDTYRRAYELCDALDDDSEIFTVLWGLRANSLVRADYLAAKVLMEDFLIRAEKLGDPSLLTVGHAGLGVALCWLGEFEASIDHCEKSISYHDPVRDGDHAFRYGQDTVAYAYCLLGWAHWIVGNPARAVEVDEKLIQSGEEANHPFTLTFACHFFCWLHVFRSDVPKVMQLTERLEELARRHGFPLWAAHAKVMRGWISLHDGRTEDALAEIAEGVRDARASGSRALRPYFLSLYARALAKAGRPREGLEQIAQALEEVEETNESWCRAEVLRVKGQILDVVGAPGAEVESVFKEAWDIADRQRALGWQLELASRIAQHRVECGARVDPEGILRSLLERIPDAAHDSGAFGKVKQILTS